MRARSVHAALFAGVALLVTLPARTAVAQARAVPTPASVLGFEPGADRRLPQWSQVVSYFNALAASSPRIQVRTLGRTTLGRPFIAAFIGDPATLARLDRVRADQAALADPARVGKGATHAAIAADAKVVVLVTSSIHSTEVGGILTPLRLAHRLVTADDAEARDIRRNTVVILVPSLNPDGVDIVGDWYRASLGTAWEGTSPPTLYHHYTGHDNNRDWYAFTQAETRMVVDSLYTPYRPQIVNDIHQQGSAGSRIFIPPYMDPIEPNIDPILMAGVAQMGKSMTWRMTADGFTGIANNTSYDGWTPARAYQHYHGAIRILTETASAALASPITVAFDSLRPGYNVDPKTTGVDFLTRWNGGRWTIGDIVNYQTAASWALLAQAADDRALWLRSYAEVQRRAAQGKAASGRGDWPATIVIPAQPARDTAIDAVLQILQRGQVVVRQADENFVAEGRRFQRGAYLISTAQPYGAFAKTLLEVQHYPDLREYPGGPPKRPYDVVAHTLPLLYGFDVVTLRDATGLEGGTRSHQVAWSGSTPPIAWTAPGLTGRTARRIAIFRNASPAMDEGWTRWVLDQHQVPFTMVTARDIRAGGLAARFDAIILPDQAARVIARGPAGSYPDSLKGGLGDAGAAALGAFVDAGGTIVALNNASDYAISALSLPVQNVVATEKPSDFYAPGSLLKVELDRASPLAAGMTAPESVVWFEGSPVFAVTDSARATTIARYPAAGVDPLASGWLLGAGKLAGRAAMVDVQRGRGHVVLFGFRPQYRGQSMSTFPLLWNALRAGPAIVP
jgi:hypothetical protein